MLYEVTSRIRDRSVVSWAFPMVTLLVWVTRIRNVVGDDTLDGTGTLIRVVLAVTFVAGALVTLYAVGAGSLRQAWRATVALAGWTTAVWLVRGAGILVDGDHSAGFKVVHTVLAIGSIALAAAAVRAMGRRRHLESGR